jgi:16S rRNA (guanine966-N2)-methyltransferase
MKGVRVTGGRFKGRTIAVTKGGPARFTSSKVREAVFDIMGSVEGLRVLDLFAGTGSFTVEALSRGAATVTAVEQDRRTAALLKENLKVLSIDKDCLVLNMDVRYAVPTLHRQGKVFDLLFADPPYEMGYVATTIDLLAKNLLCDTHSVVVLEHSKRETPDGVLADGYALRTRRYGDTVLSIVTRGGE